MVETLNRSRKYHAPSIRCFYKRQIRPKIEYICRSVLELTRPRFPILTESLILYVVFHPTYTFPQEKRILLFSRQSVDIFMGNVMKNYIHLIQPFWLQSLSRHSKEDSKCIFYQYSHGNCFDGRSYFVSRLYKFKCGTRLAVRYHRLKVVFSKRNRKLYVNNSFSRAYGTL